MASAEKCPVCDGSGQYRPATRSTIQLPPQRQCHGCQGRGWIEVVEAIQEEAERRPEVEWVPLSIADRQLLAESLGVTFTYPIPSEPQPQGGIRRLAMAMWEGIKALREGKPLRETVREP